MKTTLTRRQEVNFQAEKEHLLINKTFQKREVDEKEKEFNAEEFKEVTDYEW